MANLEKRVVRTAGWHVNRSAVRASVKKPPSGPWDGYFYDGPTLNFGHFPSKKKAR